MDSTWGKGSIGGGRRQRLGFCSITALHSPVEGVPEEGKNLCHDGVIGPYYPSAHANAASVWGSQKAMSMARYRSMAADSAARACSCWPVAAYSVPRSL